MSKCNRISIEKAENGYTLNVGYEQEEGEMYEGSETFVATDEQQVVDLVKEHLGVK